MASLSSKDGISLSRAETTSLRPRVPSELQAETSFGSPGAFSTSSSSYKSEQVAREGESGRTLFETIDGDPMMNEGAHAQSLIFASDSLPSFRRAKAKSHLSLLRSDSHHGRVSPYHADDEEESSLLGRDQLQLEYVGSQEGSEGGREGGEGEGGEGKASSFGTFPSSSRRKKRGRWYKLKRKLDMKTLKKIFHHCKVALLTAILVACIIMFAINSDESSSGTVMAVTGGKNETLPFGLNDEDGHKETMIVTVALTGPFNDSVAALFCNDSDTCSNYTKSLIVCGRWSSAPEKEVQCSNTDDLSKFSAKSCCLAVPLLDDCCENVQDYQSNVITVDLTYGFEAETETTFEFFTIFSEIVPFTVQIDGSNLEPYVQVIIAALILAGVYVLIIFELVHRAMAAMLGSTAALAVLSMLQQRPTLTQVLELIEWNTIWLLFGMMILVALFSQSGFFDWSAVKMYKLARGKTWPLIFMLCAFAGIVSAFLDNVTTILLLTPVSIRLSQVLNLDPKYVLIAEVIFSNIGGTATAIGDPPNVIIVSSPHIREKNNRTNPCNGGNDESSSFEDDQQLCGCLGIDFNEFTLHVFLGIIFVFLLSFFVLRLLFWVCRVRLQIPEPPEVAEMKRELAIWQRTAARLPVVSLEERAVREALHAKAHEVQQQLQEHFSLFVLPTSELWKSRLPELEAKYTITDKNLLLRSSAVLLVVIVLFFVSNLITELHFDLGWIAIFGAVTLMVLADVQEIETVLEKVEWGTLVFFAALFVLMELLAELGLINFIASSIVWVIEQFDSANQMTVAMLLILWVSALASAFIDNIPFTAAIIPVIVDVANPAAVGGNSLCVSLRPLVWALALGACLGGNGTLIGASANVVCAGIAEQNGYPISFRTFFKIGFPMMLFTVVIAMVYLLICHSWIGWDIDTTNCQSNTTNATYFY